MKRRARSKQPSKLAIVGIVGVAIVILIALAVVIYFVVHNTLKNVSASVDKQNAIGSVSSFEASPNLSTEAVWAQWKQHFNKSYSTEASPALGGASEHDLRYNVFKQNYAFVQAYNADPNRSDTLGLNHFSDLTYAEWNQHYKGLLLNGAPIPPAETATPIDPNLPDTVDWRNKGAVTAVKNQSQCGSCWSFGTTGVIEGARVLQGDGKLVALSEQQLVDCDTGSVDSGCNGGLQVDAYQYVIKAGGLMTEADYPYTSGGGVDGGTCKYDPSKCETTITSYTQIASGDENALMNAVANVGPVTVGIDASSPQFQSYKSGVYAPSGCSTTQLDHAVLVVGYGSSDDNTPYWIVKNSWGTDWGMEGYFYMKRGVNQCGIATSASYVLGAKACNGSSSNDGGGSGAGSPSWCFLF